MLENLLCCTAPKIYLQMPLLCSNYAYQESIIGSAYSLTFCFCINSDCVGVRNLLSKDIGKEMVTCELLSVAWLLLMRLVVAIIELPHGHAKFRKTLMQFPQRICQLCSHYARCFCMLILMPTQSPYPSPPSSFWSLPVCMNEAKGPQLKELISRTHHLWCSVIVHTTMTLKSL